MSLISLNPMSKKDVQLGSNPFYKCLKFPVTQTVVLPIRYYHFYRPGDFVLYRNKERYFEVGIFALTPTKLTLSD